MQVLKPGDLVSIDGEEGTVVHVTPTYPEGCRHDWEYTSDEEPTLCKLCGMSFQRYLFCYCP